MGDNELGLPAWLNNLLQPGVGKGAFLTLKLSLIGTVLTALSMLYVVTDEQIRFHLYVFTSLAVVLTGLVFWFIAEAGDAIFQPEAPKKMEAANGGKLNEQEAISKVKGQVEVKKVQNSFRQQKQHKNRKC